MAKKRSPLIVVNCNIPYAIEVFSTIGEVIALETNEMKKESVRNADILVVRSETRVDEALLDGSSVRFVGTVTIGTDHIDCEYLNSRRIEFASAPGSNANSVAEYVAAALLTWGERTGQSLRGKTIGIVGVGNVGSRVVKVVQALGMIPLRNDPPLARRNPAGTFLPLESLMNADFITLHVPLTAGGENATHHLFDANRLKRMKRGSVLINTARGGVVETEGLKSALASSHLSAAILDVWEKEPTIDIELLNQALLATPHIAGYSLDGKLNALKIVFENVCRFLDIRPKWTIDPGNPDGLGRLSIQSNESDEQRVVALGACQAYNIELDDDKLRSMSELPSESRREYFMRLRNEYRVRREFFNYSVKLSASQLSSASALRTLGFKVSGPE